MDKRQRWQRPAVLGLGEQAFGALAALGQFLEREALRLPGELELEAEPAARFEQVVRRRAAVVHQTVCRHTLIP